LTAGSGLESSPDLVRRYEQVRDYALRSDQACPDAGQALFLRRGMAAWMQAWLQVAPTGQAMNRDMSETGVVLPANVRGEMVLILASMALGTGGQR
jgi:hypothetical protein